MSRYDCRRCDWRPATDDDSPGPLSQLSEHAFEQEHWLCSVCGISLPRDRIAVCTPCLADTRRRLTQIVETYAILPTYLGRVPSASDWRRSGPRGDGNPLLGGDVLSMLASGSGGRSQIRGVLMPDGKRSVEHEQDEHVGDPPSVAHELASWEDDWRLWRGEPAAEVAPDVSTAANYLLVRLPWAADTHEAFAEFATDVRRLLSRLETATATGDRDDVGASCFSCGTDLRRTYADPKPCRHERPSMALQVLRWTIPEREPKPVYETVLERDARVEAWELQHEHCRQGGMEPTWHCPRHACGRVYTLQEYTFAMAAEMHAKRERAHYWVPIATAARLVERTQATVRQWTEDERVGVPIACDVKTRRLHVLLASVFSANAARKRRRQRVA
jgi:5-hydroxyisourate hydrolase-like protein (transthyretin family)